MGSEMCIRDRVKPMESQISHSGPRGHKTGSKNERINKSHIRFFARLSVSNINLYVRISEKLRSVLRELVLRWNEGSRSGQHRLFFNCQTKLDHSDN